MTPARKIDPDGMRATFRTLARLRRIEKAANAVIAMKAPSVAMLLRSYGYEVEAIKLDELAHALSK